MNNKETRQPTYTKNRRALAVSLYALTFAFQPLHADGHKHAAEGHKKSFNFEDPKGVNSVSFTLDAPLEQIVGSTKGVSGIVSFSPKDVDATEGRIIINAKSLTVTNDVMKDHMLGDGWLDTDQYPEITFEVESVSNVKETGKGYEAIISGPFTLKGTTKTISAPVTFTYLPNMLGKRTNGKQEGDLLVLRSTFTINRSDFGIKPGQSTDKVAEEVELRLAIAGAAPDKSS